MSLPAISRTTSEPASSPGVLWFRLSLGDQARTLLPLVVALVAVGAYSAATAPQFLTTANLQNILEQVAVLGVLAVGATVLLIAGQLDLSVASGTALMSVVAAKLLAAGGSEATVVPALLLGGAAIGTFTGLVVAVTRVEPFIFTLGMLSALAGIALILSGEAPIQTGLALADLSVGEIGPVPVPGAVFLALCLLAWAMLRYTRLGRAAYAIGSNEEAAYLAGVSVAWTKVLLYALNGALVGLAALLLVARLGSGDPGAAVGLELKAVTAAVLGGAALSGGRGSVLGTVVGVLLLGVIGNALNLAGVASSYETVVLGGVLMIAVVWASLGRLRRQSRLSLRRQIVHALGRAATPAGRTRV